MFIVKKMVTRCELCDKVRTPMIKDPDWIEPEDNEHEETAPMVYDPEWPGVLGYAIRPSTQITWPYNCICEPCANKLIRAVNLINGQKLNSVDL